MKVTIESGPAFSYADITLPAGGSARLEAGAMAAMRGDVEIQTSTRGGFMSGLKRTLGGESFFVNDFVSKTGGSVGAAAVLPGDMTVVSLGGQELFVQSGGWIASDTSVAVDSSWGGAKGFFSGAGLVLLRCSGEGDVLIAAYGAIRQLTLDPGERLTLDTGHIVAFDPTVQYGIRKAGGSWKTTLLGGEGLVCDFVGPGRVWMQTRSSTGLIGWLDAHLPRHDAGS